MRRLHEISSFMNHFVRGILGTLTEGISTPPHTSNSSRTEVESLPPIVHNICRTESP